MDVNLENWQIALIIVLAVWEVLWKGIALWRAAHRDHMFWFGLMLVLNTAGVLPIIYLLMTSRSKQSNRES